MPAHLPPPPPPPAHVVPAIPSSDPLLGEFDGGNAYNPPGQVGNETSETPNIVIPEKPRQPDSQITISKKQTTTTTQATDKPSDGISRFANSPGRVAGTLFAGAALAAGASALAPAAMVGLNKVSPDAVRIIAGAAAEPKPNFQLAENRRAAALAAEVARAAQMAADGASEVAPAKRGR